MMTKKWLFGHTLGELENIVTNMGMPRFVAAQIADWLYVKRVLKIEQMNNLSKKNRELLSSEFEIGAIPFESVALSNDGTKKYLFPTLLDRYIESAYIPDRDRATLCVSSQAGCRMGCKFCATGAQGFAHNLTTGEILNQINTLPEFEQLTNVVYMGMGEPLDNLDNVLRSLEILTSSWGYGWSPTRITLSTIGIIPALKEFLERTKVHLAVSLHNPLSEERVEMMPVDNRYPIGDVVDLLRNYDFAHQRRISFEYIVFEGVNDTTAHIAALSRMLAGLKCRINLIRFHTIPGSEFRGAGERKMIYMRDALTRKGIITTIRTSRGEDIQAACGLLSTEHEGKSSF